MKPGAYYQWRNTSACKVHVNCLSPTLSAWMAIVTHAIHIDVHPMLFVVMNEYVLAELGDMVLQIGHDHTNKPGWHNGNVSTLSTQVITPGRLPVWTPWCHRWFVDIVCHTEAITLQLTKQHQMSTIRLCVVNPQQQSSRISCLNSECTRVVCGCGRAWDPAQTQQLLSLGHWSVWEHQQESGKSFMIMHMWGFMGHEHACSNGHINRATPHTVNMSISTNSTTKKAIVNARLRVMEPQNHARNNTHPPCPAVENLNM